ncbi:PadR family transcriptional regulator [Acetivibrio clariflavus]|uniref:Putative transcriptional regulator n=1 Tax=Acetivibrio clariflavus (strain DSM 19732 / NBRC 101661 / EBR45) TaxID=720554 RepID=G8M1M2_ACECE|nr:PadR family transcriptional regulator [Acetivibrio clariflavus]AEV70251.1 putative transcriptional regulator [Acetivibrio clariflavus DSM 19732]
MNIQFKKGVLELCVLSLLAERDYYGYEIVNKISEEIEMSNGTIYPLLKRLYDDGYFETYMKEPIDGPPRKYYKITPLGIEAKKKLEKEWFQFVERVNNIVKNNGRTYEKK